MSAHATPRSDAGSALVDLGADVAAQVARLLGHGASAAEPIELQKLHHKRVFRARAGSGAGRGSLVIKRLQARAAERNRLVAQRWLPWLGLHELAPALLATAAGRDAGTVWHVYEDVGGATLRAHETDRDCVAAAVDALALLHTRAAGHPVACEARRQGEDFGSRYFTANVSDALSLLDALRLPAVRMSAENAAVRDRLRLRLERLLETTPDRASLIDTAGGADTLLHGDLWAANVLLVGADRPPRVAFIDWDHAGAGPFSYDVSCFLRRFAAADRAWIMARYRAVTARAGWQLPADAVLDLLFESAECARYANRIIWPALALLHDGAPWGFGELAEIEQWFAALTPLLTAPQAHAPAR